MAIDVTYDAPSNTITVTGGTEGTPATFADIQTADDGGGWSVITNPCTGVYCVDANVDFGGGGIPTFFKAINTMVSWNVDKVFRVKNQATVEFGEKINSEPQNGCYIKAEEPDFLPTIVDINGVFNLYNTILRYRYGPNLGKFKGVMEWINVVIQCGTTASSVGAIWFENVGIILKDVLICHTYGPIFAATPDVNPDNLRTDDCKFGIQAENLISFTLLSPVMTNAAWYKYRNYTVDTMYIINPSMAVLQADVFIEKDGDYIYIQYRIDIHIADKDGINLAGVAILCQDTDSNAVFNVNTNANGDIAQQTITAKHFKDIAKTEKDYSPFKFTISKAGYETMVLDAVTVDSPIVWHLELLDELAEGDVRDGVAYGEDSEGNLELPAVGDVESGVGFGSNGVEFTGDFEVPPEADVRDGEGYGAGGAEFEGDLDLPAIGDVEKGVQFDSLTKTGTFKKPTESDVRDGEGYGEDDTEFTGTLDLPAEADVEDGVVFDGATKEGNFEAPAEADVEKDVGYGSNGAEFTGTFEVPAEEDVEVGVKYGAGGTEFEGEYLGLTGTNLTAVLENETNLTATLEEETNMTGYLEKVC